MKVKIKRGKAKRDELPSIALKAAEIFLGKKGVKIKEIKR